ncbi:hypothetical protein CF326_g7158 [Tilletia indica]|nr:hypothetical protein CF326_g7158 [Tilletia indica]
MSGKMLLLDGSQAAEIRKNAKLSGRQLGEDDDEGIDRGPTMVASDQSDITRESPAVAKPIGDTIFNTTGWKRGKAYILCLAIFIGRTAALVLSSESDDRYSSSLLAGSTRAPLIADYLHTSILISLILCFALTVYSSAEIIGSPSKLYELLQKVPAIPGNAGGSLLTMRSREGLVFGVVNIIGNFGTVFLDQSYHQRGIASATKIATTSFIIGGLDWSPVPLLMASFLGTAIQPLPTLPPIASPTPTTAESMLPSIHIVQVLPSLHHPSPPPHPPTTLPQVYRPLALITAEDSLRVDHLPPLPQDFPLNYPRPPRRGQQKSPSGEEEDDGITTVVKRQCPLFWKTKGILSKNGEEGEVARNAPAPW